MVEIYKINEVYRKGKRTGAIFADCSDAEWLESPDMMAKVSENEIEFYYGHKSYDSAYNAVKFTKKQVHEFQKLIALWLKRRMSYAQWDGYGAMYKGQIGWTYAKPFSTGEKDYKLNHVKVTTRKTAVQDDLEGFAKVGEESTNGELTSETIQWAGYRAVLERNELGIRKGSRGFILLYGTLKTFNALIAVSQVI